MMAPCFFIGLYPLGRLPLYTVYRFPDCASLPLSANRERPLFLSIAVTNLLVKARWFGFQELLPPGNSSHSRCACTHGRLRKHPPNQHSFPKLIASMAPAASAFLVVSLLP